MPRSTVIRQSHGVASVTSRWITNLGCPLVEGLPTAVQRVDRECQPIRSRLPRSTHAPHGCVSVAGGHGGVAGVVYSRNWSIMRVCVADDTGAKGVARESHGLREGCGGYALWESRFHGNNPFNYSTVVPHAKDYRLLANLAAVSSSARPSWLSAVRTHVRSGFSMRRLMPS